MVPKSGRPGPAGREPSSRDERGGGGSKPPRTSSATSVAFFALAAGGVVGDRGGSGVGVDGRQCGALVRSRCCLGLMPRTRLNAVLSAKPLL